MGACDGRRVLSSPSPNQRVAPARCLPKLPLLWSRAVVWHDGQVARAQRAHLLGQRALTVGMTGLSAAGKSTLAFAVERALES